MIMSKKYIVKEGVLSKFLGGIAQNIIDKKRAKNMKALKNDPKLKKLEAELAKKMKEFEDHIDSNLSADTRKKLGL
tara:strand:+ start:1905 stop:2132 length:228 start_codon:yes stop_codon:yes gene_type:complete